MLRQCPISHLVFKCLPSRRTNATVPA
jgi:hypothetical protein